MSLLQTLQTSTESSKRRQTGMGNLLTTLAKKQQQQQLQNALKQIIPPTATTSPVGNINTQVPAAKRSGSGSSVDAWIKQALGVLKLDDSYIPGLRTMIMKESSGNPTAVNNWDSNARRGTPSKGLMQTIDPTFKQWALPGYDKDVFDPVSNIVAGIRYARNRYGDSMLKAGGRKDSRGQYRGY